METLSISLGVVVGLIAVALAFDFLNGFHDAANSIATVVSTRVLRPYQAVFMAALFNFVALFVFQLKVATTVGAGIIDQGIVDQNVVLGALIGAIAWDIITWWYGIPSSSSHALIGGIMGAGVAKAGMWALVASGVWKIVLFIILSPLIGFVLSLGHGGNDAQKTAGLIWMLLIAAGYTSARELFPLWVAAMCYVMIALGTLAGG